MNYCWTLVGSVLTCHIDDGTSYQVSIDKAPLYLLKRLAEALTGTDTLKVDRLAILAIKKQEKPTIPTQTSPKSIPKEVPPDPEPLWGPYIMRETLTVIYGERESKKSQLACWLAAECSNGNLTGTPEKVLYCHTEDDVNEVSKRILRNEGTQNVFTQDSLVRFTQGGIETLEVDIVENEVKLVIFDALRGFLSLHSSKIDCEIRKLTNLASETGCTFLGVHHAIKNAKDKGMDGMRGTGTLADNLRSVLMVTKLNEDISLLEHVKSNNGVKGGALRYTLDKETLQLRFINDNYPEVVLGSPVEEEVPKVKPHKGINFCNKTVNPLYGCKKVSPGCANCYAEVIEQRFHHHGLTDANGNWTGKAIFVPSKFKVQKKGNLVCFNSMGDLCHEDYDLMDWNLLFSLCRKNPQHTIMFQTKRSERLHMLPEVPDNVYIGVTVENAEYLSRIDDLRAIKCHRFVSFEPLLGPIGKVNIEGIEWCYIGGESGHGARPMQIDWALKIIEQAKDQGTLCWFKQLGSILARQYGLKPPGHDIQLFAHADLQGLKIREHFHPGF
jgi:protein gp37